MARSPEMGKHRTGYGEEPERDCSMSASGDHAGPAETIFRRHGLALNCRAPGGQGETFVFQHGLCGDAEQTFQVLPERSRIRPITLECRGHGGSEPGDLAELTIATFAADVAALVDERIGHSVILGGISMGAAIALRLAVQRPDLVRGLVLARPAWVTDAAPVNMRPNAEAGRLLLEHDPATARAMFAAGATAQRLGAEAPANLDSLLSFFDRRPTPVTAALLTQISDDGPGVGEDAVAALRVPTLVIGNDHDSVHPLSIAAALADLIPGAQSVVITSKAVDRAAYVTEFRNALARFLAALVSA